MVNLDSFLNYSLFFLKLSLSYSLKNMKSAASFRSKKYQQPQSFLCWFCGLALVTLSSSCIFSLSISLIVSPVQYLDIVIFPWHHKAFSHPVLCSGYCTIISCFLFNMESLPLPKIAYFAFISTLAHHSLTFKSQVSSHPSPKSTPWRTLSFQASQSLSSSVRTCRWLFNIIEERLTVVTLESHHFSGG